MKKSIALGILILAILLLQVGPSLANKSTASIEGPTNVAKGTEVTLRVTVKHNANSSSHYTEWLKVTANKKEIARWEYSCNRHGSRGPATHRITVK
jgi:desulfoferrodoxin (superoxide reductase-like protein)